MRTICVSEFKVGQNRQYLSRKELSLQKFTLLSILILCVTINFGQSRQYLSRLNYKFLLWAELYALEFIF